MKKYLIIGILAALANFYIPASTYALGDTESIFNAIKTKLLSMGLNAGEINDIKNPICEMLGKGGTQSDLEKFMSDLLEKGVKGKEFKRSVDKLNKDARNGRMIQAGIIKNKDDCLAVGGKWESRDFGTSFFCILPTEDKGKECGDMSECQGACMAVLTNAQESKLHWEKVLKTNGKCTGWTRDNGCDTAGMEVYQGVVGKLLYCP